MRTPLILFFVGLAIFAAFAGPRLRIHTKNNHFVYLADSFLHGSAELVRTPEGTNDWANYQELQLKGESARLYGPKVSGFFTKRAGKPNQFRLLSGQEIEIPSQDRGESQTHYFVSFPPGPAVLMMPMVALFGYGTNDVLFTLFFAALNVSLVFLLLRKLGELGYSQRSEKEDIWLSILFAFGSAHLWCAVQGGVWFTALIIGVTFNLLYIYASLDTRHPFWAGLALAAAFSTRATMIFAALFFYMQLFFPPDHLQRSKRETLTKFLQFSAPCLVVGLSLLYYNAVRFDRITEFGHTYLAGGTIARIRDFGMFDIRFLTRNLTSAFTLMPRISDSAPYIQFSTHGTSLLLTTPALTLLLWPRRSSPIARPIMLTALAIAIPIFLYQNTGWEQFSFRFSLDFMPYLIAAIAIGGYPLTKFVKGLIIAGILVNAFGAVTFKRTGKIHLYADYISEEPKR